MPCSETVREGCRRARASRTRPRASLTAQEEPPLRPAIVRPRFVDFQDLMRHRVLDILLVASPYDAYVLEEAGELAERMLGEFRNLDLHYAPGLTAVATGAEALELLRTQRRFNLIVATPRLADMHAGELARRVAEEGIDAPVVLLARDLRELAEFEAYHGREGIERAFVWQGDARVLLAIVKSVEDRRNVEHDAGTIGVQVILLVEDGVRQYSSFLPAMYGELLRHSQRVIAEGLNLAQKILRMRARPKILLATDWEEAESLFERYASEVLGVVSDVEFPRGGTLSASAGAELVALVRGRYPDIPILLHSSHPEYAELAERLGVRFLLKGSPHLLSDLGSAMLDDFGFGDFVFRLPDGTEVARAGDLRELEERLRSVPDESVVDHAARNHFSRWLKARTEFAVADELRPHRPEEYPDAGALRAHLVATIADYRAERGRGVVADFDRERFDFASDFYRIGGGSLGGKGRGLAFARRLIAERGLRRAVDGLEISVPPAAVVGSTIFDAFLDESDLRRFAFECDDDRELFRRFGAARLPAETERDLAAFLEQARFPLAVRSSSLLEDSRNQPFTGVYETLVVANDRGTAQERLAVVGAAIRRVYASVFTRAAQAYLRATGYRLEEEKMAVILQRIAGRRRGPEADAPLLSDALRRRPIPQLLSAGAGDDRGRHRVGRARARPHDRRRRAVPAILAALSASPAAARLGAGGAGDHPAPVLGAVDERRRRVDARKRLRARGRRGGRHPGRGRFDLLAGERPPERRRRPRRRAPGDLRADPGTGAAAALQPRSTCCSARARARDGHRGGARVRGRARGGRGPGRAPRCSSSARWRSPPRASRSSSPESTTGGSSAGAGACSATVGEDAEVAVAHRDHVDGDDEGRRAQVRLVVVPASHLADLVVGGDHRLLESGVDEILFRGPLRESSDLFLAEDLAGHLLDRVQEVAEGALLEALLHPPKRTCSRFFSHSK